MSTIIFSALIFGVSCLVLAYSGKIAVKSLGKIAEYLRWKEFTVSFLLMSIVTAFPELFVGISSAVRGVSELSFGNIIGQSIIHYTLAVAVCVLLVRSFKVSSPLVRASAWYTSIVAILPVLLISDRVLSRADGLIILGTFVMYFVWLFSKRDRFAGEFTSKDGDVSTAHSRPFARFLDGLKDLGRFIFGVGLMIVAAQGIVFSTISFSEYIGVPLVIVGALIVSVGTALPEIYFSAVSAKNHHDGLMLGNLLGSTAVSVSLVLGVVSIISPISVPDLSPYFISRLFLIIAIIGFLVFMSIGRNISKKEALMLLGIYLAFILSEVFIGAH